MKWLLRRARRKVGFRAYDDDEEYWYADVNMLGAIMDLVPSEPHRGRLFRRKEEETEEKKPTFGFGRVLDE